MRIRSLIVVIFVLTGFAVCGETLDLPALLQRVEQNSRDLELARKDLGLAETDIRAAWSSVFPTVAGQGSYTYQPLPLYAYQGGGKMEIPGDDNQFSAGVNATQKLFDLTALAGIKAATEYKTFAGEVYGGQNNAIVTMAKKAFYQVLLLQRIYEVRQASEQNALENYQDVQRRFESGVVSQLAVLQAEVAWKQKIPDTTAARKNLDVALINLKHLAGIPSTTELTLDGSLGNYPPLPDTVPVDRALEARPDYRVLESQLRLQEIGVEAARASGLPKVQADVTYGYGAQSDKFKVNEQQNNLLQFTLSMNVPIYLGGAIRTAVNKAQVQADKVRIQIDKKREDVQAQLDGLTLRLREANQRIQSAESTMTVAQRALEITQTSVDSGLATQLELKDAQVSADGARLGYYSAIYDYLDATFDWQQAIGTVGKE